MLGLGELGLGELGLGVCKCVCDGYVNWQWACTGVPVYHPISSLVGAEGSFTE